MEWFFNLDVFKFANFASKVGKRKQMDNVVFLLISLADYNKFCCEHEGLKI